MTDTAKTWIDERQTIHAKATPGPWEFDFDGDIQGRRKGMSPDPEMDPIVGVLDRDEDNSAIVDAHNMLPRALDALNKVLELHHEDDSGECAYCYFGGANEEWPCATVQAIEEAIND